MKYIDVNEWPRKDLFEFFSGVSHPFYSVNFGVDVTNLYYYVKEHHLSFYYALTYLCTKAMNEVEAFRYTIDDKKVALLDERIPSFTDLKKGSEYFHIVTMECEGSIDEFCRLAKETSRAQKVFLDYSKESNNQIFFSCLPWIELTALTNERNFDVDDATPRLAWGKFVDVDGRKKLNMSLEVNHRFIDGLHIGRFYEQLQAMIDELTV